MMLVPRLRSFAALVFLLSQVLLAFAMQPVAPAAAADLGSSACRTINTFARGFNISRNSSQMMDFQFGSLAPGEVVRYSLVVSGIDQFELAMEAKLFTWSNSGMETYIAINSTEADANGTYEGEFTGHAWKIPLNVHFQYTIDGFSNQWSAVMTMRCIAPNAPVVTLAPVAGALPSTFLGTGYGAQISADGGRGPYTYFIASGALPPGLELDPLSGRISGRTTSAGNYTFQVDAFDSDFIAGSATYTLLVERQLSPRVFDMTAQISVRDTNVALPFSVGNGVVSVTFVSAEHGILNGQRYTPAPGFVGVDRVQYYGETADGTRSPLATITVTVVPDDFTFSPVAGTLPAGRVNTAYRQVIAASGTNGAASYALSGTLPAGLQFDTTTGVISGTPTGEGTSTFAISATDQTPMTRQASYSLEIQPQPIVALPLEADVDISGRVELTPVTEGGTPASLAIASQPANGIASVSGLKLVYTPRAGWVGFDTFYYTASNAGGPSSPARVTIRVVPRMLVMSPPAGSLTGGQVGSSYRQSISTANGVAPYEYRLESGALPDGLTLEPDGTISGIPTVAGVATFTVEARDQNATTALTAYSLAVQIAPPAVSSGTMTVAANSGANTVPLTLTGGPAETLSISAAPSHGEATVSGLAVAYTPDIGFSGSDQFSVTATNSSGTSAPATITVTVMPPQLALSPASGALADGQVGQAYGQTFSGSLGTGPYVYAITRGSLPQGLRLDSATGVLSGTPTGAGTQSFTVTTSDVYGATGSASYSVEIRPAPPLQLSPSAGSLVGGQVGQAYDQQISASLGTAPYGFAVTSGTLPQGLLLDSRTGRIAGAPTAAGTQNFTITATDAIGTTGSANYSLTVRPARTMQLEPASGLLPVGMAGEAFNASVTARGGVGAVLYRLASGALPPGAILNISTGAITGPLAAGSEGLYSFSIAAEDRQGIAVTGAYQIRVVEQVVSVTDQVIVVPPGGSPPDVYLNRGATGGPFTLGEATFVDPPIAGTARVTRGQLAQAAAAPAPAGWYLQFTPNPAYSGRARVGFRLVSALGASAGTITYTVAHDAQTVAAKVDSLVHGFVRSRQSLIANSIAVPGLMARRAAGEATAPVTTRMTPAGEGVEFGFATSLAQLDAARDGGGETSPFNIWLDGSFLWQKRDAEDARWGSFAMLSLGADYLVSDRALVGVALHYDRMSDPTDSDAELTGHGVLAGPYASLEIGKGVFWDTSLFYGGSWNEIDTALWDGAFDTRRWLFDTSLSGEWMLDAETVLTPALRAVYLRETVDDYAVSNAAGDRILMEGFDEEQFRISLGAEIARDFTLADGSTLTPRLGVTAGYAALDGEGAFGELAGGFGWQTADQWMIDAGLLFGLEGDGTRRVGGRVKAGKTF